MNMYPRLPVFPLCRSSFLLLLFEYLLRRVKSLLCFLVFGKKKTPFASDILEVAIDQFWDEADLPDELQEEFFHSMIEAGYGSTFPGEIDNRQQNLFEDK